MAELLGRPGVSVAAKNAAGQTPIHLAALRGDSADCLELLLSADGADPNCADSAGVTPLMCAASVASKAGVEALLAKGADKGAAARDGATACTAAARAIAGFGVLAGECALLLKTDKTDPSDVEAIARVRRFLAWTSARATLF